MYKYDEVSIEVTRKCNNRCEFCMRGEPQNITIDNRYIDKFFYDIEDVETIFLTGGEPFLEPSKIEYIVDSIINKKFKIKFFSIVTNGTILDENVVHILEKLILNSPDTNIFIIISDNPEFYDIKQSKKALEFYRKFIEKNNIINIFVSLKDDDGKTVVYSGKGKKYVDNFRNKFYPYGRIKVKQPEIKHRLKIQNNKVHCKINLNALGEVGLFNDCSYLDHNNLLFGNLDDYSLTELIDKHNNNCTKLCKECEMFTLVYNNLVFLPPEMQNIYIIFYEFLRLYTLEVWHKRELIKEYLSNLPPSDIIDNLPIAELEDIDFKYFNSYSEADYKNSVEKYVWERYLEEKEINIDMHEGLDIIMNAIVELKNKQRVSKKGQYDIFLDDENFLKSDTFNWFNKRNEKYKLGLLTYDNEKSYA